MQSLSKTIKKLILGIKAKYGYVFLLGREQFWSIGKQRVGNRFRLTFLMDFDEYMKRHPKSRKKFKADRIKVVALVAFREIDIVLYLAEVLKTGVVTEQAPDEPYVYKKKRKENQSALELEEFERKEAKPDGV